MKLSFLFKHRLALVMAVAIILFLAATAFAQTVQKVIFTFNNGASPVSNLTLFVFFPEQIQPANLSSGMVWNLGTRTLTVALNQVTPNQKISLPISITGLAGTYQIP